MACAAIENLFLNHSQLIRNDVAISIQETDFYIKRITKEPWLDGSGYQFSYPVYERSMVTKAVTDADFFVDYAVLDPTPAGSGNNLPGTGACNLTGHNIDSFGVTVRVASLKKAAVNSPDICLSDLKFQWQVTNQIANVTRVLGEQSRMIWANQYQDEVIAASANKITAGVDGIDDTFGTPTSQLTFGLLEEVHQQLGFNGGSMNPTARMDDETPVYTAVGSLYTFNRMKKSSTNQRNDFQYASSGGGDMQGVLVAQLGLGGKIYQGYKFAVVQFPPRHTSGGVRIFPYSSSNASQGKKWNVSDAYKNAFSEDTVIYHDDLMKILVPKPDNGVGAVQYEQKYSWAGDFTWRNIPDRECNIDNDIGFFRARFAYGVKVNRPDLGFVIRALHCDIDLDLAACS